MDGMIYTAMSGAKQILMQQANNNHNLANVNTTGFRASYDYFSALPVYGEGEATRVLTHLGSSGLNFDSGSLQYTGRNLDIAVQGNGFIAVQSTDGREAYTRAGDIRLNENGFLETGGGYLVLGNGGPIALPPFEKLEIAGDGTISIIPVGQSATTVAAVDRIKLVAPDEPSLTKGENGLLYSSEADVLPIDANVRVVSGSLESSNVNAIDAMVNMITLARAFELNVKLMQLSEENDQATAQILRLNA